MTSFSVLTRDAPAQISLVRDSFSFCAFLLGPLWFAWNRAWLGAVIWILGVGSVTAASAMSRSDPETPLAAIAAFMFLMGLEASEFRRRSLLRRGYRLADVVEAQNRNEAETRFFSRRFSQPSQGGAANPVARAASYRAEPVGLFFNGT